MSMNKTINLFFGFVILLILAFYAVGFTNTVSAPNNTTAAGQQYANLTSTVTMADIGINAALLLIITAFVLSAIAVLMYSMKRR